MTLEEFNSVWEKAYHAGYFEAKASQPYYQPLTTTTYDFINTKKIDPTQITVSTEEANGINQG